MPSPGISTTWGADSFASFVLDHLQQQSVLLRSGARRINVVGKTAHIPRLLNDGAASWVGEMVEIPSSAPDADEMVLTPKGLKNLVAISNESIGDSSPDVLDQIGLAMTRATAKGMDDKALSADVATATAPAGIRSQALPFAIGAITVGTITSAVGAIAAEGGVATAVYLNPNALTTIRQSVAEGGYAISDPTKPGIETIAGARLWPTSAFAAGTALVAQADQIVVGIR